MDLPKLNKVSEVKKKKIVIFSDDLRMASGVGTMTREFVMGTLKDFDWVQVGGAIKHPDAGKLVDMNDLVRKETGVEDANLKIYPVNGYGDQKMLRYIMKEDKLTSVKVIDELYRKFREKSIRDDFSLQKLVNRSLDLFVYDEEFQKKVLEYDNLEKSGSKY
jgi:hypothetical protein